MGNGGDIASIVLREDISELIVTSTRELPGEVFQGVMDAYEHGVAITPMPILYERMTDRVPVEHVGDNWAVVLPIGGTSVFNPYPMLKRMMDVCIALIGLILFAPIFLVIAMAIKLDNILQLQEMKKDVWFQTERGKKFRETESILYHAESKAIYDAFIDGPEAVAEFMGLLAYKERIQELFMNINQIRLKLANIEDYKRKNK